MSLFVSFSIGQNETSVQSHTDTNHIVLLYETGKFKELFKDIFYLFLVEDTSCTFNTVLINMYFKLPFWFACTFVYRHGVCHVVYCSIVLISVAV